MRKTGHTLKTAQELRFKMQKMNRQFDFVNERPRSNTHKPPSKARSKLPS